MQNSIRTNKNKRREFQDKKNEKMLVATIMYRVFPYINDNLAASRLYHLSATLICSKRRNTSKKFSQCDEHFFSNLENVLHYTLHY